MKIRSCFFVATAHILARRFFIRQATTLTSTSSPIQDEEQETPDAASNNVVVINKRFIMVECLLALIVGKFSFFPTTKSKQIDSSDYLQIFSSRKEKNSNTGS